MTKRTRRGRYPAADPYVLAYIQGERCPDGVQLSPQARKAIACARFFGDITVSGQLVDVSKFGAVPEDQRDRRWCAA